MSTACPDALTLAAYVEGGLDAQARNDIERHIADCVECPFVVAEAVRFAGGFPDAAGSEAGPAVSRQWWWVAAAIAAAVLSLPAIWQLWGGRDSLRRVKAIAAALPERPVEGRLVGFAYAPFEAPRSASSGHGGDIAFRAEAEQLTGAEHAQGVALLLGGDVQLAVEILAAAAKRNPDDAILWNDLAAAHLAAATAGERAELHDALMAADRAIALDPELTDAHFNRGVVLERLGRSLDAAASYTRAIRLDPRSKWSAEARARIARLRE